MGRPISSLTKFVLSQPKSASPESVARAAKQHGMTTTAHYVQRVRRLRAKEAGAKTKPVKKTSSKPPKPAETKPAAAVAKKSGTKSAKTSGSKPVASSVNSAPKSAPAKHTAPQQAQFTLPVNKPNNLTRALRAAAIAVIVEDGARVARAVVEEAIAALKQL